MDNNMNIEMLQEEIRALEMEVLDMFAVCFHFAGLKESYLEDALDLYQEKVELEDSNKDYDSHSIIRIINDIKDEKPQWFNR